MILDEGFKVKRKEVLTNDMLKNKAVVENV